MIFDLEKNESSELEKYDICIIGAGAAGITIAKEFASSSVSVALVESGDFELHEDTQNLYKGEAEGNIPGTEGYLYSSRLRFFGGTTNHWEGWCRPLDEMDFQERDWVPNSGWPISKQTLEPYYRRAENLVEINSFEELDKREFQWSTLGEEANGIRAPFFQWSPPTRFGVKYKRDITEAENIDLFLNANLTNIKLTENRQRIDHLKVESLNNNKVEIESRSTVLACGGIENPRILLNCSDDIPQGIGNQNDLVGKYFMEHPHYDSSGMLLVWDLIELGRFGKWNEFRKGLIDGVKSFRVFSLSNQIQKKEGLLNISFEVEIFNDIDEKHHFVQPIVDVTERLMGLDSVTTKPQIASIYVRAEQEPKRSNSVTLLRERDEIGLQKVRLSSSVSEHEVENYQNSLRLLARGLGLHRDGRLRVDLTKGSDVIGWGHHMGTTRMSDNPQNGVVDADCKVHGIDNLFIAGSSVFPTVGFANPTLTIVALAVRLADHLKNLIDR